MPVLVAMPRLLSRGLPPSAIGRANAPIAMNMATLRRRGEVVSLTRATGRSANPNP
jgi:hypothetical protein